MEELEKSDIRGWLDKYKERHEEAAERGKTLAEDVLKESKYRVDDAESFGILELSILVAHFLNTIRESDKDPECALLVQEWAFERLVYMQIKPYSETFDRIHEKLVEKGFNRKNKLDYGDYDGAIWTEPSGEDKIIIAESYCAMRDDNTIFFIKNGRGFHARRVWPKQVKHGIYIHKPSLNTYRKSDWEIEYCDSRDLGYCFSLSAFSYFDKKVSEALYKVAEIHNALWNLDLIDGVLEEV